MRGLVVQGRPQRRASADMLALVAVLYGAVASGDALPIAWVGALDISPSSPSSTPAMVVFAPLPGIAARKVSRPGDRRRLALTSPVPGGTV